MLNAFNQAREQANVRDRAASLPDDNNQAIAFALAKRSLPMLMQVRSREAGALDGFIKRKTALMNAVLKDNAEQIKLLCDAGATINLRTRAGDSALDIAVQENKLTALKQLLACPGIDVTSTYKKRKSPLHIAYEKKNLEAFVLIASVADMNNGTTKNLVYRYLFEAIKAGDHYGVSCLLKIPNINVNSLYRGNSLVAWALKQKNLDIIALIFPLSNHLLGFQLSHLIKHFKHFNSLAKYEAFFDSKEPMSYLESFSLCDPVTLEALKILYYADKAAELDKIKAKFDSKSESAMDDKKVSGANLHFDKKVKPHFKAQFEAMGLLHIEQRIREAIIQAILDEATLFKDEPVVEFITKTKEDLIKGESKAMTESLKYFAKSTASHAAWRCYNPFAKVSGDWPNLHTRPERDHSVYSTQASSFINGTLKSHQASDIIRERTAYYFLAVTDPNDGSEQERKERMGNFIGLLAEIRNTHKADDPSCFPGQLTRIAAMGNFHKIAEQPSSLKEVLANYFRAKVFQRFKEKIEHQNSASRQELLDSLVLLTQQTAKEHITNPGRFKKTLLKCRQSFIESLGNELAIINEIRQETSYPFDDEDLVYVQAHLVDIAKGDIALALSEYLRRLSDRAASVDDIAELALFGKDKPQHQALLKSLMTALYAQIPSYRKSVHQLQNTAAYFANKISQLFEQPENAIQYLSNLANILETDEKTKIELKEKFSSIIRTFGFKIQAQSVTNPYVEKLKTLREQIAKTPNPLLVARFEKMIPQMQRRADLFAHFIPYLDEVSPTVNNPSNMLELVQMLVDHCVLNGQLNQLDFKQELPEDMQLEHNLETLLKDLIEKLPEGIAINKAHATQLGY